MLTQLSCSSDELMVHCYSGDFMLHRHSGG
jgi:hypothetical protein